MKSIVFFNNKGGVGKTTLVYHLAWMYRDLGLKVLAIDLDPQANLTVALCPEDELEALYESEPPLSVMAALRPLIDREGDIGEAPVVMVEGIALIPGDLALHEFDDRLAETWPKCLDDKMSEVKDAIKVQTAFYRVLRRASAQVQADVVLIDVGPSLGALNRSVLLAADAVVVPLAADLFSLRGLRNVGPTLRQWRQGWNSRRTAAASKGIQGLPDGAMRAIGYVALHHAVRDNRPVKAYRRWIAKIPVDYHAHVLQEEWKADRDPTTDPHLLATTRNYMSLMALSQESRKPVFALTARDGAMGGHAARVAEARGDFERLARRIADKAGIPIPN